MLETKEQSNMWKEKAEEAQQKFKTVSSTGKMMLTVFWDHWGPIYWEFRDDMKFRVSKDTYFDILNNLRNAIKSKCPGLLSRKLCLLLDNKTFNGKCSSTLHTHQTSCQATSTCSRGSRKTWEAKNLPHLLVGTENI